MRLLINLYQSGVKPHSLVPAAVEIEAKPLLKEHSEVPFCDPDAPANRRKAESRVPEVCFHPNRQR